MWRWDGQRWVPSGAQMQQVRPASRTWIWWAAGGCALLLLVGIGGVVWGAIALSNAAQHGTLTCLPSDFPSYPGASVSREYTYFGTGVTSGDTKECQMTLQSSDASSAVHDFYASQLKSGDWTITSDNTQTGVIRFHRVSRAATVGEVLLLGRGQQTQIQIVLDS